MNFDMKKLFLILLACFMLFSLSACGPNVSNDDIENDIENAINNANINVDYILVHDYQNKKIIGISLANTDDYSVYGNEFITVSSIVQEYVTDNDIPFNDLSISAGMDSSGKYDSAFIFTTTDFKTGDLVDNRSGSPKLLTFKSFDELAQYFPALNIENSTESISDEDMKIYNEVWAALDAEPSRPEDEIFAELAPRYNMTGEELKNFVDDIMFQIYS